MLASHHPGASHMPLSHEYKQGIKDASSSMASDAN
jgi:hypothetical protein